MRRMSLLEDYRNAYLFTEEKNNTNNVHENLFSIIILDRSFKVNETMNSICIIGHKSETLDYNQCIHTLSINMCACIHLFACFLIG